MTVDLSWLKGVLEMVHAHIHIYIYPGPWHCQMLPTHAFCLFTWLWSLLYGIWGPNAPTSIALSQPLYSLVSGFDFRMLHWVGKMDAWIKSHSRSGSAVSLHIHEPENVRWLNPQSTDGQTCTRTNLVCMLPYDQKGIWWNRCDGTCCHTEHWILTSVQWRIYCTSACETQKRGNCLNSMSFCRVLKQKHCSF